MLPEYQLTETQQHVLTLMSTGASATHAARTAGIHRNTIANWLRKPAFRETLAQIRRDRDQAWRNQIAALSTQAVAAVRSILDDPQATPALRLQAAIAVGLPKLVRTPSARQIPSAAPPPPPVPRALQPGRNQPCPCGSGKKFKRCCIAKC